MRRYLCVILLICCIFMCSCGENSNNEKNFKDANVEANLVDLFIPDEYGINKSETKYQLKQPDSINACIEEMMDALIDVYDGKLVKYNYMMDEENTLSIKVTLNNVYYMKDNKLIIAAITNTLFALDGINKIDIELYDMDDNVMYSLLVDRSTFYLYGYSKDYGYNYNDTVFYLPNEAGDGLVKSKVKLYSVANDSFYKRIVNYLVEVKVIPAKTVINSVIVDNKICYVDFNTEFESSSNVKSSLIIYSIVNTLTSLDDIDKVVITEEGSLVDNYKKTVDVSKPLQFNQDLVK